MSLKSVVEKLSRQETDTFFEERWGMGDRELSGACAKRRHRPACSQACYPGLLRLETDPRPLEALQELVRIELPVLEPFV